MVVWLFGTEERVESFLLIEANRFVYSKNHTKEPLNINAFKAYVKHTRDIELAIAKDNDRMAQHSAKWDAITILL